MNIKAMIFKIYKHWYWYCPKCGLGPYINLYDSCGVNGCKGKRPPPPDSDD